VEQTRKAESRAQAQLAKADAAHLKLREREAQEAHLEAMLAEVEERNQQGERNRDGLLLGKCHGAMSRGNCYLLW
jgi:hypothetical protein